MKTGWLKFLLLSSILLGVTAQEFTGGSYTQSPQVAAYTSGQISPQ